MANVELEMAAQPTPEDVRFLEDRLYEFNVAATGIADGEWLAIFARSDGAIVGGVAGSTWGGCCEIRQLWVDERFRGRGLGKSLMEAAEVEARRRSCRQIVLTTHSFQAPDFYRKLGFERIGAIADYPAGHENVLFRKSLVPSPP